MWCCKATNGVITLEKSACWQIFSNGNTKSSNVRMKEPWTEMLQNVKKLADWDASEEIGRTRRHRTHPTSFGDDRSDAGHRVFL